MQCTLPQHNPTKPFEGVAPTGKQIQGSGITILRFANGKIVEDRFEAGGPSIQEQLTA